MTIEIFHGHNVRIEIKDDKVWFALKDVCDILNVSSPHKVVERIKENYRNTIPVDTGRGVKDLWFINERGLIRVLQTSRSPLAEPFQDWADERIEQLMNGKTVNAAGIVDNLSRMDILKMAIASEEERLKLETENKELKPKAEVYDKVLTPEHTMGIQELTSSIRGNYPVNMNQVKDILRKRGVIHKNSLKPTAKAIDGKYAVIRPVGSHNGRERFQARFTTKTLEMLLEALKPLDELEIFQELF